MNETSDPQLIYRLDALVARGCNWNKLGNSDNARSF